MKDMVWRDRCGGDMVWKGSGVKGTDLEGVRWDNQT